MSRKSERESQLAILRSIRDDLRNIAVELQLIREKMPTPETQEIIKVNGVRYKRVVESAKPTGMWF